MREGGKIWARTAGCHRGRGGKEGIQQSRWRTDGSDYHSILRDGGRETERLCDGEIIGERE